jgi:hypothetical protein
MDLGAIQAELETLRAAAVELAMAEPGPFAQLAREQAAGDGGERSEHRGPFTGPRPRPFAVVIGDDEAWPFAGVAL